MRVDVLLWSQLLGLLRGDKEEEEEERGHARSFSRVKEPRTLTFRVAAQDIRRGSAATTTCSRRPTWTRASTRCAGAP